jgi:hypothetical protein
MSGFGTYCCVARYSPKTQRMVQLLTTFLLPLNKNHALAAIRLSSSLNSLIAVENLPL